VQVGQVQSEQAQLLQASAQSLHVCVRCIWPASQRSASAVTNLFREHAFGKPEQALTVDRVPLHCSGSIGSVDLKIRHETETNPIATR
jgi:hypothetical protein